MMKYLLPVVALFGLSACEAPDPQYDLGVAHYKAHSTENAPCISVAVEEMIGCYDAYDKDHPDEDSNNRYVSSLDDHDNFKYPTTTTTVFDSHDHIAAEAKTDADGNTTVQLYDP